MENKTKATTRRVKAPSPSVDLLRELLGYCPTTGKLTWRVQRGPSPPGSIAGSVRTDGYLDIQIGNFKHKAHRLAWAIYYGTMPPRGIQVDHIDGNPANNRIENLRLATRSENQRNRQHLDRRNRTGFTGVFWRKDHQRWEVNIRVNRKTIYIGSYLDKQDAIAARRLAEATHFGEFAPKRNRWPSIQGELFQEVPK